MNSYEEESWFDLFVMAMSELEHAAITGRIGAARTEIAARLETLKQIPGLHTEERQAIQDALLNLRVLEDEERLAENERKRLLQEAAQKLQSIAPRLTPGQQQDSIE